MAILIDLVLQSMVNPQTVSCLALTFQYVDRRTEISRLGKELDSHALLHTLNVCLGVGYIQLQRSCSLGFYLHARKSKSQGWGQGILKK